MSGRGRLSSSVGHLHPPSAPSRHSAIPILHPILSTSMKSLPDLPLLSPRLPIILQLLQIILSITALMRASHCLPLLTEEHDAPLFSDLRARRSVGRTLWTFRRVCSTADDTHGLADRNPMTFSLSAFPALGAYLLVSHSEITSSTLRLQVDKGFYDYSD